MVKEFLVSGGVDNFSCFDYFGGESWCGLFDFFRRIGVLLGYM
ncbi:MAG: hypothetical protein Q6352_005800 [Candidatus Freyrarchaeum guaymaensis]|nr:hypothetical protein [Candidatus Sigynarchaeota archaeon]